MFYRVDYVVAVILAGLIVGALLSRRTSRIEPSRVARGYFVAIAILITFRLVVFVCSVVLTNAAVWNKIGGVCGDVGGFLFGGIFGIAALRNDRREVLCDPLIYSALCLATGIGFVLSGYVKALYIQGMIDFFTQSGYSTPFLKFIMTIEVVGGIGLLIPLTAIPAIAGLSIDMFGAIYTHIHNGDPLNDSTGAIGSLIRLSAIAALWAWRPRPEDVPGSVGRRFAGVGVVAALCVTAAVSGGTLVRHLSPPTSASQAKAHVLNAPSIAKLGRLPLAPSGSPKQSARHS